IDVDGNDYWFLRDLISLRPAVIIAEYNSNLLRLPITIPYDADFYYRTGPDPFYHGASLAALGHLTQEHGYALIAVGSGGINAFFVREDLLGPHDIRLNHDQAYREQWYADGLRAHDRWERMKDRPFVDVTVGQ